MPSFTAAFRGVIQAGRGGGAFVELNPELAEPLGGTRVRVKGTINGVAYSSNTMPMGGGRFCLGVHKATREAAAARVGDEVRVTISPDPAPRVVHLPDDLVAAFAAASAAGEPELIRRFEALSGTNRREVAAWIAEAKHPPTRAARVEETLDRLRELR
jgi:hypothetical protein